MARASAAPVLTLTCGFDEADFDERKHAAAMAAQFGADHQSALITADASGLIDTLAWHFDEPFADASAIPMYGIARQARRRATVMLSGDGGDELLAGYRRYRFDRYEDQVRRIVPGSLRRPLFGLSAAHYPDYPWMPRPFRARATLRNLSVDAATAHGQSIATIPTHEARNLLHPDLRAACRECDPQDAVRAHYDGCDAPDHLSKCQYVDIRLQLADGILTKVDRASMAHGLEVRSPLLDYELADFCWRIPPAARIRGTQGKWPLRLAVARHVSREAARRVKAGFDVPMDQWFRGPLRERFCAEVSSAGARSAAWISRSAVERLWSDHLAGRANHGATLWKLAMLESWAKAFSKSPVQELRRQRVMQCSVSSPTESARSTS
jgi:asparagine synthase (glutamine-hydrolysing)